MTFWENRLHLHFGDDGLQVAGYLLLALTVVRGLSTDCL